MSSAQRKAITITRLSGRDGSTSAELSIPEHRAKECLNTDFYQAPFGRKRNGATSIDLTGASFTGIVSSLHRVQLGAVSTGAKLLGVDDAATPVVSVLSGGSWSGVTMKDNIATRPWDMFGATLNGLYYYTGDTTQDRLHVFNGTATRRVGLATPAAATVANTGAGAYAATARYYKVCYTVQSGGVTLYRSELSPSVSFTPSGGGTAARITKPASISEDETHWEVYASTDNEVFYGPIASAIAVATTTYDDSAATTAYALFDLAPFVGQNTVPTSWKYITSDGNRLIGAGSWESGGKVARVWFTPVIGTTASTFYDQERVPDVYGVQQNWMDLDESDGGVITGIIGPYYGAIYVFKDRQIWKLVPTGDGIVPYRPFQIGRGSGVGALCQQAIVMAEDERGAMAIYFWAHNGPYRLTVEGLQYIGADVEDISVNLDATNVPVTAVYHTAKHQIWWYVATSSANDPDVKLCLDTQLMRLEQIKDGGLTLYRNGWTKHTGPSCVARCAVMFSTTYASSTSRAQVPYIGRATGTAIWRTDTGTTDNSTAFQAYQQLPYRHYGGVGKTARVTFPILVGNAGTQTITVSYTPDYGLNSAISGSVSMAATGSETRVTRQIESVQLDDTSAVAITVGDGSALDSAWTLDALTYSVEQGRELSVA